MINLGRAVGLFNKFTPKITKGIGQVANIARNVGQAVKNVRNIGSTVNEISGGRIGNSRFGQKMQDAELHYLVNSRAASTALAENYVGLPLDFAQH